MADLPEPPLTTLGAFRNAILLLRIPQTDESYWVIRGVARRPNDWHLHEHSETDWSEGPWTIVSIELVNSSTQETLLTAGQLQTRRGGPKQYATLAAVGNDLGRLEKEISGEGRHTHVDLRILG